MSQFTLNWNAGDLVGNTNCISQSALYRYRLVGGSFISTGFSPANPLATTAITVDSPTLNENQVIQFEIQVGCTLSGPSYNDNGIQEVIEFAEIVPTITETDNSSTITIDATNTDITKAKFTLRKSSDNSIVGTPTVITKSGSSISYTQSSLNYSTNYYWQVETYATVNSIEVVSSDPVYVGSPFSPYPFTTSAPAVCNPTTSLTVSSIEM